MTHVPMFFLTCATAEEPAISKPANLWRSMFCRLGGIMFRITHDSDIWRKQVRASRALTLSPDVAGIFPATTAWLKGSGTMVGNYPVLSCTHNQQEQKPCETAGAAIVAASARVAQLHVMGGLDGSKANTLVLQVIVDTSKVHSQRLSTLRSPALKTSARPRGRLPADQSSACRMNAATFMTKTRGTDNMPWLVVASLSRPLEASSISEELRKTVANAGLQTNCLATARQPASCHVHQLHFMCLQKLFLI
eukprot:gb/GFBE01008892.1/.p1 GENE.gb/GFBE01008892.1/~~gb/GFBE01008892.1/.p1  ORF type:complete len:250 (+),score=20.44 gb/GFBE01008892.1/:1-750(+)